MRASLNGGGRCSVANSNANRPPPSLTSAVLRNANVAALVLSLLGLLAGLVSTALGIPFISIRPVQSSASVVTEWIVTIGVLVFVGLAIAAARISYIRRPAVLLCFWGAMVGPVLVASVCFLESCLSPTVALTQQHRMECMVVLSVGLLFQAKYYSALRNKSQDA